MSKRTSAAGLSPELRQRLEQALSQTQVDLDFVVEDLELLQQDGSPLLRVTVDSLPSADSGLDLDRLAAVSRAVSQDLDAVTELSDAYLLEVSTPGPDRALTQPYQLRRNVGRLLRVSLTSGREFTSRLVELAEDSAKFVGLPVKGRLPAPEVVNLGDIAEAFVEFELNPPGTEAGDQARKGE